MVDAIDINEYSQLENLKETVDIDLAKAYIDKKEGADVPKRKVRAVIDSIIRKFILEGIFED